jgi:two-component system nitrogen regulation response regulator NtrX
MSKVLVVDDEAVCSGFLALALEAEGFEVKSAIKADEAIAIANTFSPDFLVTDWMLKDSKDGIDIARAVATQVPNLKVIFITGMPKETLVSKAQGINLTGVLVKPIDIDQMVDLLKSAELPDGGKPAHPSLTA